MGERGKEVEGGRKEGRKEEKERKGRREGETEIERRGRERENLSYSELLLILILIVSLYLQSFARLALSSNSAFTSPVLGLQARSTVGPQILSLLHPLPSWSWGVPASVLLRCTAAWAGGHGMKVPPSHKPPLFSGFWREGSSLSFQGPGVVPNSYDGISLFYCFSTPGPSSWPLWLSSSH